MGALRFPSSSLLLLVLAGLSALGCGPDPAEPGAAVWVVPTSFTELSGETFFDHPWPSDLRLEDGKVRLTEYPNPREVPLLDAYMQKMTGKLDGFSPGAAGYLRFSKPLDPQTLPVSPLGTLDPSLSSVQLLDIDPSSPDHGHRHPVAVKFRVEKGVYYQANTLAFMPAIGFPLRPQTKYALVVTNGVRTTEGGLVEKSAELSEVLGAAEPKTDATRAAKTALASAITEITGAGISTDDIVSFTVFTTNDPTAEFFEARDHLRKNVPAPTAYPDRWAIGGTKDAYTEYLGAYGPSPNYQEGKLPFNGPEDGGDFHRENGSIAVVNMFDLRFSLTVPNSPDCPMPDKGFPIVLYAHGTGGDFRSYVRDLTSRRLAYACVASMGIDQIFHGRRPGAPKDGDTSTISKLFFNIDNVIAARTNNRQSALDEVQRARLFTESHLVVPASVSVTGKTLKFDSDKLMFFGHSQGGLNGPLFLAGDDQAIGGVLSGSSSVMSITLLEKTKPSPSIADLVRQAFLFLQPEEYEELDLFHPGLSLAQMLVDTTDPQHYARFIVNEPRAGGKPKSVYMTEGINPDGTGDSYAPPRGIEAHALSIGLPLELPAVRPYEEAFWPGAKSGGSMFLGGGIGGNLAGGAATGVLAQWAVPEGSDGHFVIFDVEGARNQSTAFLKSLAAQRPGKVTAE